MSLIDFSLIRKQIDIGEFPKGELWNRVDKAARKGDPEAQFILGYRWYRRHGLNYQKSRDWFLKAASGGHLEAQEYVAQIQEELGATRQDLADRAKAGELEAQRGLACILATGSDGLGKYPKEARDWYRCASQQGDPAAQYNLGLMVLNGEGGPCDAQEGVSWLEQAANGDNQPTALDAMKVLADLHSVGALGVARDHERAKFWNSKFQDASSE